MAETTFSFGLATDSVSIMRRLIRYCIESLDKMDKIFGINHTQMYLAYRTIKVGQTVDKFYEEGCDYHKTATKVIQEVLNDFPIGREQGEENNG